MFYWVLLGFTGFYWVLRDFSGWTSGSPCRYRKREPVPIPIVRCNERSLWPQPPSICPSQPSSSTAFFFLPPPSPSFSFLFFFEATDPWLRPRTKPQCICYPHKSRPKPLKSNKTHSNMVKPSKNTVKPNWNGQLQLPGLVYSAIPFSNSLTKGLLKKNELNKKNLALLERFFPPELADFRDCGRPIEKGLDFHLPLSFSFPTIFFCGHLPPFWVAFSVSSVIGCCASNSRNRRPVRPVSRLQL